MRSGATPESRHGKHRYWDKPMSRCRECAAAWARCRAKVRYLTQDVVNEVAMEKNVASDWNLMLAGYRCPYCTMYHLTRAKQGTVRWKRVEKRRRKWLCERMGVGA